ncbi:MAG: isopenicillin N synthase family oxygenase [Rhodospirillaceae bacterium]|jgi:isopenicillin N synthase-like dioxygenase|nr:isopenicillin N synthase family oxygenase [Rhodospirillaceae bacterium]MBT4940282.1 isopenicillin N synthase family oxygenase [Rhodospirillaceae bacterium]MBT5940530.1 isopenicillin N synthase family oxygenase [Rhodospirillaceae bacterium]MBT7268811.1 isopenicillin N synthase family oxygenase [Rhodospirillaceae bacterium]
MPHDIEIIRTQELPILDIGSFLDGKDDSLEALGEQLRYAAEIFGFFFLKNHGISQDLIDKMFAENERFHNQSMEKKSAITVNDNQRGYIRPRATLVKHSTYNENTKLDSNETTVFATEYGEDNPHRQAGKRFYGENQWPENLPGFKEVVQEYMTAMTALGKSILPIWARGLELERDFFAPYFEDNYTYFRMAHYPPDPNLAENDFGLGPHADTGFMTLLPQANIDGLEVLDLDDKWFRPPRMDGLILVNTGQFLERWSNERFRASPHRVMPPEDVHRYSIPVFVNTAFEPICECLPTCHAADNPPKYPTESYWDFYQWYMVNTYPHFGEFDEQDIA